MVSEVILRSAVGVQHQLVAADALAGGGRVDEPLGDGLGLGGVDAPPDDRPREDVQHHIQVGALASGQPAGREISQPRARSGPSAWTCGAVWGRTPRVAATTLAEQVALAQQPIHLADRAPDGRRRSGLSHTPAQAPDPRTTPRRARSRRSRRARPASISANIFSSYAAGQDRRARRTRAGRPGRASRTVAASGCHVAAILSSPQGSTCDPPATTLR